MPFITIEQRHALSRLRDIGYKTFHTIWDESYDMIEDPKKRMTAIIDLVLELNGRKDFREMMNSCRDIVDHNYKMLQMRRPENKMISVIMKTIKCKAKGRRLQQWFRDLLIEKLGVHPEDIESRSMGAGGEDLIMARARSERKISILN